jgi:hypothetical protein
LRFFTVAFVVTLAIRKMFRKDLGIPGKGQMLHISRISSPPGHSKQQNWDPKMSHRVFGRQSYDCNSSRQERFFHGKNIFLFPKRTRLLVALQLAIAGLAPGHENNWSQSYDRELKRQRCKNLQRHE